jgi:hypothetical protein
MLRVSVHLLHVRIDSFFGVFSEYVKYIPRIQRRFCVPQITLKVPKREIFDRSDFTNFYTIKSSWVGDFLVKILTYYFNF